MNDLNLQSRTTLNDGRTMPWLGLGLFQITDKSACHTAIHAALDGGYRHFDTAVGYRNEADVGSALAESAVERETLFITSKLMPDRFGHETARRCVENSLQQLRVDYIDLYLIHWPVREKTEETYETLQELREEGKLRSIGVSNFTPRRFEEQFFKRIDEIPAVNQFERHPYCANNDLVAYCRQKDIQPQAYSPLAQAEALEDPTLAAIAHQHGKTTAQVMIRWQLQQGIVVIPKSANPKRIAENADVFDFLLSETEMTQIAALDQGKSIITWRPEDDWF